MTTLYQLLDNFSKAHDDVSAFGEEDLNANFREIAERIIYGGYILVHDRFRVYARCVEFYFHEETGPIKDPIVYHRNEKFAKLYPSQMTEAPYFPLMSLHAHASGYDITFENETAQYRASALIREYSVYDVTKEEFVIDDDRRSTFLYYLLNGFPLNDGNSVCWKDVPQACPWELNEPKTRKNVHDARKWSFSAKHKIDCHDSGL